MDADLEKTRETMNSKLAFPKGFNPLKGFVWLSSPKDIKRTDIWRPSVALASYPDLKFDDYYLLYSGLRGPMRRTFDEVVEDIKALRPKVNLHIEEMAFKSPWDMVSVFTNLYKFAEAHASEFSAEGTMCYVNCNHGTMQIRESLFMLSQEGKIPGMRILPSPWHDNTKRDYRTPVGSYAKDDPSDFNEAYRKLSIATKRQAKNNGLMEGIFVDKSNTEFLELLNQIFFVAQKTKEPILFTGPTGSGKSNLARNIAKTKGLKDKFVSVNCATLGGDPGIIKSELFGHDKGDFTDALPFGGSVTDGVPATVTIDAPGLAHGTTYAVRGRAVNDWGTYNATSCSSVAPTRICGKKSRLSGSAWICWNASTPGISISPASQKKNAPAMQQDGKTSPSIASKY